MTSVPVSYSEVEVFRWALAANRYTRTPNMTMAQIAKAVWSRFVFAYRRIVTKDFGKTLFVAIILFILALFPFILKYKELFAQSLPNPHSPIIRFVRSIQEWLLVGVTLSASASLNWFESRMDERLRSPSAVWTAFGFIGGLLCIIMFAYYRSIIERMIENIGDFADEIPWIILTVILTSVAFFLSVLQCRREKDEAVMENRPSLSEGHRG